MTTVTGQQVSAATTQTVCDPATDRNCPVKNSVMPATRGGVVPPGLIPAAAADPDQSVPVVNADAAAKFAKFKGIYGPQAYQHTDKTAYSAAATHHVRINPIGLAPSNPYTGRPMPSQPLPPDGSTPTPTPSASPSPLTVSSELGGGDGVLPLAMFGKPHKWNHKLQWKPVSEATPVPPTPTITPTPSPLSQDNPHGVLSFSFGKARHPGLAPINPYGDDPVNTSPSPSPSPVPYITEKTSDPVISEAVKEGLVYPNGTLMGSHGVMATRGWNQKVSADAPYLVPVQYPGGHEPSGKLHGVHPSEAKLNELQKANGGVELPSWAGHASKFNPGMPEAPETLGDHVKEAAAGLSAAQKAMAARVASGLSPTASTGTNSTGTNTTAVDPNAAFMKDPLQPDGAAQGEAARTVRRPQSITIVGGPPAAPATAPQTQAQVADAKSAVPVPDAAAAPSDLATPATTNTLAQPTTEIDGGKKRDAGYTDHMASGSP